MEISESRKIYNEARARETQADLIGKKISEVIEPAIERITKEADSKEAIRAVVDKLEELKDALKAEITIEI